MTYKTCVLCKNSCVLKVCKLLMRNRIKEASWLYYFDIRGNRVLPLKK